MRRFRTRLEGGFTLLEMCIVLSLIALLAACVMFQIGNVFTEQELREDSSRLGFLIHSGMLRAQDENAVYLLTITARSASLVRLGDSAEMEFVPPAETESFHEGNELWMPQGKLKPWVHVQSLKFQFAPGQLCPIQSKLRWTRGESWLIQEFDPLTAQVSREEYAFQ